MLLDEQLDSILKEMWRMDEKRMNGEAFTVDESLFWSNNIDIVIKHYESNARYWTSVSGVMNIYSAK